HRRRAVQVELTRLRQLQCPWVSRFPRSTTVIDDRDRPAVIKDSVIAHYDSFTRAEWARCSSIWLVRFVVSDGQSVVRGFLSLSDRATTPIVATEAAVVTGYDIARSRGGPPPTTWRNVGVRGRQQE